MSKKLVMDNNVSQWKTALDQYFGGDNPKCPYCGKNVGITSYCGADRIGFLAFTCDACEKIQNFSRVSFPKDMEAQSF